MGLRLALVVVLAAFASVCNAYVAPSACRQSRTARSALAMKFSPVKVGVEVKVIAGDDKGKTGKVLSLDRKQHKSKNGPFVVVEGVNILTKHQKPRARGETGKRVQKEGPIHISNVQALDKPAAAATEE